MCWLVFVGASGYHGDVAALFDEHGLVSKPSANPVLGLMPADAVKVAISDGHCACSIYPAGRTAGETADDLRERYRRSGWTHAKIERAVQARLESNQRNDRRHVQRNGFPAAIAALAVGGAQV